MQLEDSYSWNSSGKWGELLRIMKKCINKTIIAYYFLNRTVYNIIGIRRGFIFHFKE